MNIFLDFLLLLTCDQMQIKVVEQNEKIATQIQTLRGYWFY